MVQLAPSGRSVGGSASPSRGGRGQGYSRRASHTSSQFRGQQPHTGRPGASGRGPGRQAVPQSQVAQQDDRTPRNPYARPVVIAPFRPAPAGSGWRQTPATARLFLHRAAPAPLDAALEVLAIHCLDLVSEARASQSRGIQGAARAEPATTITTSAVAGAVASLASLCAAIDSLVAGGSEEDAGPLISGYLR